MELLVHLAIRGVIVAATIAACSATDAEGAWPRRQRQSHHVPHYHHGYYVAPTYSYMPPAYPYGSFGARRNYSRVVYHDYNFYLRSYGVWPGH